MGWGALGGTKRRVVPRPAGEVTFMAGKEPDPRPPLRRFSASAKMRGGALYSFCAAFAPARDFSYLILDVRGEKLRADYVCKNRADRVASLTERTNGRALRR